MRVFLHIMYTTTSFFTSTLTQTAANACIQRVSQNLDCSPQNIICHSFNVKMQKKIYVLWLGQKWIGLQTSTRPLNHKHLSRQNGNSKLQFSKLCINIFHRPCSFGRFYFNLLTCKLVHPHYQTHKRQKKIIKKLTNFFLIRKTFHL